MCFFNSYPACNEKDKPLARARQPYAKVFELSILDAISNRMLSEGGVLNNLDSWALRDAPVCPSNYDVIMMSPPVGGQRQVYTEIASQLASLGFIVVTVDHPSLSGVVKMSDGSFVYNTAGESIEYRESELLQVANLKTVMETLASDELAMHSPLWTQEAVINTNNSCILGHGLGGRVSMLMVANGMTSCGMVLDDRMPMPGPFSEKNSPVSPSRAQESSTFAHDSDDEEDLGTVHPFSEQIIENTFPEIPFLKKSIVITKGAVEWAAVGIFKLVCYITNKDCGVGGHEKRDLPVEMTPEDLDISSYFPKKDYDDRPSYDYQPPFGYEDPFHPQPDNEYGSDGHYKYPQPDEEYNPDGHYMYPQPGEEYGPDDHYKYPIQPAPPNNGTNGTNPSNPPQIPSFPPPQYPPQYPPPYECGPDCRHDNEPGPCCPELPEPPCPEEPEPPCHDKAKHKCHHKGDKDAQDEDDEAKDLDEDNDEDGGDDQGEDLDNGEDDSDDGEAEDDEGEADGEVDEDNNAEVDDEDAEDEDEGEVDEDDGDNEEGE